MRNRITTLLLRHCVLAAILAVVAALAPDAPATGANYRGPFKGRVVDQDTGQPIEGAVVFVRWDRQRFTSPVFFDAKEVLTDKDGKFYVPANWSFLPWRNLFLNSDMIIFKAGYGHVQIPYGPGSFEEVAEYLRNRSPEKRQAMGPGWYFDVRYEGNIPVFRLKKLSTREEYGRNTPIFIFDDDVPLEKKKLLMEEMNKEEDVFRLEQEHRK